MPLETCECGRTYNLFVSSECPRCSARDTIPTCGQCGEPYVSTVTRGPHDHRSGNCGHRVPGDSR